MPTDWYRKYEDRKEAAQEKVAVKPQPAPADKVATVDHGSGGKCKHD